MDEDVRLSSDGKGLAVVGPQAAVERMLKSAVLWAASHALDLRRFRLMLGDGSDVVQMAFQALANADRYVQLTGESAR